MAGYLTTHVLDTATGRPAAGMKIDLYRISDAGAELIKTVETNADGRTDAQILPSAEFARGVYELRFHAGAYLDAQGVPPESPRFLDLACQKTRITTCRFCCRLLAIPPIAAVNRARCCGSHPPRGQS